MTAMPKCSNRRAIHYWKCDRAAAFHGTAAGEAPICLETPLRDVLANRFPGRALDLRPAGGQGNHRTFLLEIDQIPAFVRVEDGPERDNYLEVESFVLRDVAKAGVRVPKVIACDASRSRAPFAWQVLERIPHPDLNEHHKRGTLEIEAVAERIGMAVAHWQSVSVLGFGPFDTELVRDEKMLVGFHQRYEDYFFLRLNEHLNFLLERQFLSLEEVEEVRGAIQQHRGLLDLEEGVLVHKDLAFWNILGSETEIAAFIDWDDAIAGDPMDDLSLLGCFHGGPVLAAALCGYTSIRPLPEQARRRFWLHLLRNMIVKAVIRVGAGYFNRTDNFYLIGAGASGGDLEQFTRARLRAALQGLQTDQAIETL